MLVDPQRRDALEAGLVISHRLQQRLDRGPHRRQVVPSCQARPATEACSRRSCLIAHQHARAVSSARGLASSSCCSLTPPTGQAGSAQRQVRLRHTNSTGRPKHGVSTKLTVRRPWLAATTPHTLQASTRGRGLYHDPQPRTMLAVVLGDIDDVEAVEPDEQITAGAVARIRAREHTP